MTESRFFRAGKRAFLLWREGKISELTHVVMNAQT
jgi:hypothetical protein